MKIFWCAVTFIGIVICLFQECSGQTEELRLRRRACLAINDLGLTRCERCYVPYYIAEFHTTEYSNDGAGCFPLCVKCWTELLPVERVPFYKQWYFKWEKDKEKWQLIHKAVLEDK